MPRHHLQARLHHCSKRSQGQRPDSCQVRHGTGIHRRQGGLAWALAASLVPWVLGCSPATVGGLSEPGLPGLGQPRAVALSTAPPPPPSAQDVQALIDSVPGPGSDTSVPSASATFAAEAAAMAASQAAAKSTVQATVQGAQPASDPVTTPTALAGQDKRAAAAVSSGMTAEQQSSAMPLLGQANSHSTPSIQPPSAAASARPAQR